MTHVAYLQIDYARGLLTALSCGLICFHQFLRSTGLKKECFAVDAARAPGLCINPSFGLMVPFEVQQITHHWLLVPHLAHQAIRDNRLQACESFVNMAGEGVPRCFSLQSAPHPPTRPPNKLHRDNHSRDRHEDLIRQRRTYTRQYQFTLSWGHIISLHGKPGFAFLRPIRDELRPSMILHWLLQRDEARGIGRYAGRLYSDSGWQRGTQDGGRAAFE